MDRKRGRAPERAHRPHASTVEKRRRARPRQTHDARHLLMRPLGFAVIRQLVSRSRQWPEHGGQRRRAAVCRRHRRRHPHLRWNDAGGCRHAVAGRGIHKKGKAVQPPVRLCARRVLVPGDRDLFGMELFDRALGRNLAGVRRRRRAVRGRDRCAESQKTGKKKRRKNVESSVALFSGFRPCWPECRFHFPQSPRSRFPARWQSFSNPWTACRLACSRLGSS